MTIAIIDDGVSCETIPDLLFNLMVTKNGILKSDRDVSYSSHGSVCASIIRKYAPDAKIGSVKILDSNTMLGDIQNLIHAINWCIDNHIRIIHMSVGTVEPRDFPFILTVINKAVDAGCILIAATKNDDAFTYPAAHSNVLGVKAIDGLNENEHIYNDFPNGGIDFSANACHSQLCLSEEERCVSISESNSFAAPLITAKVFNILNQSPNLSFEEVRNLLCARSVDKSPPVCEAIMHLDFCREPNIFFISNGEYPTGFSNVTTVSHDEFQLRSEELIKNSETREVGLYPSDIDQHLLNAFIAASIKANKIPIIPFSYDMISKNHKTRIYTADLVQQYRELDSKQRECPVISIYGNFALNIAKNLNDKFIQDNYMPFICSANICNIFHKVYYIEDESDLDSSCLKIVENYNIDLIIYIASVDKIYSGSDILVECNDLCQINITLIEEDKVENTDCSNLYERLLSLLS